MAIALERRLANYRATLRPAADAQRATSERTRVAAAGAERLAAELDGELVRTPLGAFVRVERPSAMIPIDRERLATLPGQPPADVPLLCLDTETTGLATASGTLAFLVGLGWWEGARFRQVQLLLPDHADEPALLDELRRHIPASGWLVTYNGRGFDWPLLEARFRMTRSGPPVHGGHLDLLPLVRRLFRHRMTDARLQTAETELLGLRRGADVPGWEIPARYLQFLRDGEPALVLGIVRHNEEDVRSLARLLEHVDAGLADPVARRVAPAGDLAGLARSLSAHHRYAEALECVDSALLGISSRTPSASVGLPSGQEPRRVREDLDRWWSPRQRADFGGRGPAGRNTTALRSVVPERLDHAWTRERLTSDRARLLSRLGRHVEAEDAWLVLADRGGTVGALAWVEIAKVREHRRRDFEAALAASLAALRFAERARSIGQPNPRLERDLLRRTLRLRGRINRRVIARAMS